MSTGSDKAPSTPQNGKSTLLSTLLSGDKGMQLIAVVLIVVSGGANWFGTQQVSTEVNIERDKAVQQIHDLYNRIDDFEKRQKIALASAQEIGESNSQQLNNQLLLLERSDQEIAQLKEILKRLDEERVRKDQPPDNL